MAHRAGADAGAGAAPIVGRGHVASATSAMPGNKRAARRVRGSAFGAGRDAGGRAAATTSRALYATTLAQAWCCYDDYPSRYSPKRGRRRRRLFSAPKWTRRRPRYAAGTVATRRAGNARRADREEYMYCGCARDYVAFARVLQVEKVGAARVDHRRDFGHTFGAAARAVNRCGPLRCRVRYLDRVSTRGARAERRSALFLAGGRCFTAPAGQYETSVVTEERKIIVSTYKPCTTCLS